MLCCTHVHFFVVECVELLCCVAHMDVHMYISSKWCVGGHHVPLRDIALIPLYSIEAGCSCTSVRSIVATCSCITHRHLSSVLLHHTPPLVIGASASLTRDDIVVERLLTTISQLLARYSDVSTVGVSLEWFAGAMGKRSCESAVASASHGSFLVREGSTGERFVLCVNDRGKSSQAHKAFM